MYTRYKLFIGFITYRLAVRNRTAFFRYIYAFLLSIRFRVRRHCSLITLLQQSCMRAPICTIYLAVNIKFDWFLFQFFVLHSTVWCSNQTNLNHFVFDRRLEIFSKSTRFVSPVSYFFSFFPVHPKMHEQLSRALFKSEQHNIPLYIFIRKQSLYSLYSIQFCSFYFVFLFSFLCFFVFICCCRWKISVGMLYACRSTHKSVCRPNWRVIYILFFSRWNIWLIVAAIAAGALCR